MGASLSSLSGIQVAGLSGVVLGGGLVGGIAGYYYYKEMQALGQWPLAGLGAVGGAAVAGYLVSMHIL